MCARQPQVARPRTTLAGVSWHRCVVQPARPVNLPDDPPALLPGPTAYGWARRSVIGFGIAAPTVLLMPVAALLPLPWRLVALACLLVVALADGVALLRASIAWGKAEIRERDAGYTTQFGKRFELWQLDAVSGEVLRRPGERTVHSRR